MVDARGSIRVDALRPPPIPEGVRAALRDIRVGEDPTAPTIDADWGEPGLTGVTWAVGLFMLAHGAVLLWLHRSLAGPLGSSPERSAIQSFAVLYTLGGVVALVFAGQLGQLVLVVGLVYGLTGLTELILGMRTTQTSAMGRDWKIAGLVTVLTAAGLFLFGEVGSKALFGIVGGGAMIVGVFHLVAALTFGHDARVLEQHGRRTGP